MKRKTIAVFCISLLGGLLLTGCAASGTSRQAAETTAASTQEVPTEEAAAETELLTEEAAVESELLTEAALVETELLTEAAPVESELLTEAAPAESGAVLEDGVYLADFDTDSSMFHVNETCDGKGTLTVENGQMTIHVSLASTHIVNLYPGLAEDAAKEGAILLEPTEDTVTYSDGLSETVYGFDIPVPALDEEFDLALIGTKGKWYDHKVSVSNPVKQ
jgi:hypothetical protein